VSLSGEWETGSQQMLPKGMLLIAPKEFQTIFETNYLFWGNTSTINVIITKIIIAAIPVIPFPSCSLDLVISPVVTKSSSLANAPPKNLLKSLPKLFLNVS
jgi:hypothetical protein